MQNVIGVVFNTNRIYYFDPDNKEYKKGDKVIVETEKGLQFGIIDTDVIALKIEQIKGDLKKIIRLADQKDVQKNEKNINDAKKALENCKEIAKKLKLDMNVIDAGFTFDRNQLIFHFISSERVDFRELAKELGTTQSVIYGYENGKFLILTAFAYQICIKYNVSMDWLCGRVD